MQKQEEKRGKRHKDGTDGRYDACQRRAFSPFAPKAPLQCNRLPMETIISKTARKNNLAHGPGRKPRFIDIPGALT